MGAMQPGMASPVLLRRELVDDLTALGATREPDDPEAHHLLTRYASEIRDAHDRGASVTQIVRVLRRHHPLPRATLYHAVQNILGVERRSRANPGAVRAYIAQRREAILHRYRLLPNAMQLARELRERGAPGSQRVIANEIRRLVKSSPPRFPHATQPHPASARRPASRRSTGEPT